MVTKIYLCPSDKKYSCSWEGESEDILQHFSEEHEDLLAFTNSVTVDLRASSENKLIFYEEEIYLLQSKIIDEYLNIFLRYLGPSKIASQITFDVELKVNRVQLNKTYIEIRCGYFGISLENIKTMFPDQNILECIISVSGDFKSVLSVEEDKEDSDTEINLSDTKIIENSVENDKTKETDQQTTVCDTPVLIVIENDENSRQITEVDSNLIDEVFATSPDSGISMDIDSKALPKYVRNNSFNGGNNSIFYVTPTETSVTRSQSLNDDSRRKTVIKKHASVHSLESIQEDDLDDELHCINCENLLFTPIFSCLSGHNVCSMCAVNTEFCKVCGENINGERNAILEEKAQYHFYACKYKRNGCGTKLPYKDILKHHTVCSFCVYFCPIAGCGYVGVFKNIHQHLKLIHSSTKIFESFIATFQKHSDAFLIHEEKGIFYCCVLYYSDSVVWEAKFCGPKERPFFCELKFKEKNLKEPLLLRQATANDSYKIELNSQELKKLKVKAKNAILTITS